MALPPVKGNVVGRMPPILSVSLQPRSDGVTLKDTFVNIRDTGEFVVNIANIAQAGAVHRPASMCATTDTWRADASTSGHSTPSAASRVSTRWSTTSSPPRCPKG